MITLKLCENFSLHDNFKVIGDRQNDNFKVIRDRQNDNFKFMNRCRINAELTAELL